MTEQKLNRKFDIPVEQLEDALGTHVQTDSERYDRIVSPRDLAYVDFVVQPQWDFVDTLVRHIPLRGTDDYPYENAEISMFRTAPKGMRIGQTFVSRDKILDIMYELAQNTNGGQLGISKMPAYQIYGLDDENQKAIAFYLPAIVEHHDDRGVLLDGIHRSYLCGSAGTTVNAIHVYEIDAPLPFEPISWDDIAQPVSEKPPIDERYVNLTEDYFRDLTQIGVDG